MTDKLDQIGRCISDLIVEVASSEMSTQDRERIGAALNALQACDLTTRRPLMHDMAKLMTIHRNLVTPCTKCQGLGVRVYGATSTWRGGVGGSTITTDVCDHCWGSGDEHRHWQSWRKQEENATTLLLVINVLVKLDLLNTIIPPTRLSIECAMLSVFEKLGDKRLAHGDVIGLIERIVTGDGQQLENLDMSDDEWRHSQQAQAAQGSDDIDVTLKLDDWLALVKIAREHRVTRG